MRHYTSVAVRPAGAKGFEPELLDLPEHPTMIIMASIPSVMNVKMVFVRIGASL